MVKRQFPRMPVIGITGGRLGPSDPCGKAMAAFGAEAVLTKPIDGAAFLKILRRALDRVDASSSSESA
jgi:hypothetical protein